MTSTSSCRRWFKNPSIFAAFVSALMAGGSGGEVRADEPAGAHPVMELWPGGVPGSKGTDPDKDVPSISVWLPRPELATGSAVVVCPGGGYGMLAVEHEGKQVAEWLNGLGISAFVLKYRLGPRYHHPAMLDDAGRDPDGQGERGEMESRPGPGRDHGLLGRRPPRLDGRHAFQRRKARCRRPGRTLRARGPTG